MLMCCVFLTVNTLQIKINKHYQVVSALQNVEKVLTIQIVQIMIQDKQQMKLKGETFN